MLVPSRICKATNSQGQPCRQAPLQEGDYCFWHSPQHVAQAAEARRLGGLRRRKEKVTREAFDFPGLGTVDNVRRLLEIVVLDTLALENSVARSRTVAYLAMAALKALEMGQLELRVLAIEEGLKQQIEQDSGYGRRW